MEDEEQIKNNISYNQKRVHIKIFVVFLALGIFCFSLGTIIDKRKLPNGIILSKISKEGEYVKCDVYAITDYFATYEYRNSTTDMYYLASDGHSAYILDLSKKQYNDIIEQMNDEKLDGEEIYVYGTTQELKSDLRRLAIKTYNEIYDTDEVNKDNYSEYIVPYIINAKVNPNSSSSTFKLYGVLFSFFSLINGITVVSNIRKKNKEKIINT